MSLLALSIELDEIGCYHRAHGLPPPAPKLSRLVYNRALPRIVRFVEELKLPVTVYVSGKDLEFDDEPIAMAREMVPRGHEIGNHSLSHRLDLGMSPAATQAEEIDESAALIRRVLGFTSVGFRSPAHELYPQTASLLLDRGYEYDSSVLPCPLYFAAKFAAVSRAIMEGRPSLPAGDPRVSGAPVSPYQMSREEGAHVRGYGLFEVPISVVTRMRLPLLGSAFTLLGRVVSTMLARAAAKLPVAHVSLSGLGFLDADGDGVRYLSKVQPELRTSLPQRIELYRGVLDILLDRGMEAVTLADVARRALIS
jgi:hypothetical protein